MRVIFAACMFLAGCASDAPECKPSETGVPYVVCPDGMWPQCPGDSGEIPRCDENGEPWCLPDWDGDTTPRCVPID